jgi:hypothetical protein
MPVALAPGSLCSLYPYKIIASTSVLRNMFYSHSAPGSLENSPKHFEINKQQDVVSDNMVASSGAGWHVLLARLLVQLRASLPGNETCVFDIAHSRTLRREVPLPDFFSYCLSRLRVYAPYLEAQFREVFRLRNESRRKKKSFTMNRSISAPSGLNIAADNIGDDLEKKLSRLCVKPDLEFMGNCFRSSQTSINLLSLGKRNSEDLDGDMLRRMAAKSPHSHSYESSHMRRVM